MIRPLTYEDKDSYVRLMKMFIDERMSEFGIEFDLDNADSQFELFFKLPEVVVLVAEEDNRLVGAIAGVIGPMLFCKGLLIQEMVWYVEKEYRGKMLGIKIIKEFEKEAKKRGCSSIIMVGMADDTSNDWYIKDGYQLLQNNFYKRLL